MRLRHRPLALLVVMLLSVAAGTAVWRSAAPAPQNAATIAADLVCPACQGESVAQSQSPMAAAMRDTIARQLAEGRSPAQVRQWFVDRYGAGILTDPPHGGLGVLLWLLPAAATALLILLFLRALRRRAPAPQRTGATETGGAAAGETMNGGTRDGSGRRARRAWDAVAVGVVALVAAVALAAPHEHSDNRAAAPAASAPAAADSGTALLALAGSLEEQGRYPEAAQVYREVLRQQPDDDPARLRLALTLLRSDQPAQAATAAQQVLDHAPRDTEALLMLGLAQRATGSAKATATLRRFLAAAPDDPAAPEVRRLVAAS